MKPLKDSSNEDLIKLFYTGNPKEDSPEALEAFNELYARTAGRIIGYYLKRHVSREDLEEYVTEVWRKVVLTKRKQSGMYDAEKKASFTTWLTKIAYTTSVDHWRKTQGKELSKNQEQGKESDVRFIEESPLLEETVPIRGLSPETLSALRDCRQRLQERDFLAAECFRLSDVEGHTLEEVAEIVGSGIATVHRKRNEAREFLKTCLGGDLSKLR